MNIVDCCIERSGGIMAFADRLGVSFQRVQYWRKKGSIPPTWIHRAHLATGIPKIAFVRHLDESLSDLV